MIRNDLWYSKKRKLVQHVWRERKHHYGELIQVDGSLHRWFGGTYSTLIAFIDDATGKVTLQFADHETIKSLGRLTLDYLKKHGRPLALYTDRGRVYKVNNAKHNKEAQTQYERMLKELDIELIHALSPQAKGRVERLFRTLQKRLVNELKLRNITTMDEANEFLRTIYIAEFNAKFAVEPKSNIDFHRAIDGYDLNMIICQKGTRILQNDRTIIYKKRWFQLLYKQPIIVYGKTPINVREHLDDTLTLSARGHKLAYKEIEKKLPRDQRVERNMSCNNENVLLLKQ